MEKIEFDDYDRISDCLMFLSDNITLDFVVQLAKKDKFGNRRFFHYETSYGNITGTNKPNRSIKRTMDYYFVLNNREVFANGILLRPAEVELLLMFINTNVIPWFYTEDPKKKAFKIVEGMLALNSYNPVTWAKTVDRYIVFEPYVYGFEDGTTMEAVKMTLNGSDIIFITIDKFMGLINILKSDMYVAACINAAYAKIEPHGLNVFNNQGLGGGKLAAEGIDRNFRNSNSFLDNAKSK